jgi:hypothetical protein
MAKTDFADQLDNEDFLKKLFDDLDSLNDQTSATMDVAGAAAGAGLGAAGSFAALYGLGVTGLSAAGITSGLAAAGALIGGGMVAGVGVLAAPVAVLAVSGFAAVNYRRRKRITALQRDVLQKAIQKQNAILQRLSKKSDLSAEETAELEARNKILVEVIKSLKAKVGS